MIKFVVAALWLVAVTLGTVIFSFSMSGPKAKAPEPAFFGGLDYVKTDIISVPLMKDEEVYGYFLTRLVYTVEPAVMKTLSLPADALLVDERVPSGVPRRDQRRAGLVTERMQRALARPAGTAGAAGLEPLEVQALHRRGRRLGGLSGHPARRPPRPRLRLSFHKQE